jgi:hypothetical protein
MPDLRVELYLAALTRELTDAGSPDALNVTISVDGVDVVVAEFVGDHPEKQGYLQSAGMTIPLAPQVLTNNSVRVGIRGDDAWRPQHILLFGDFSDVENYPNTRRFVPPIAMETDLTRWLSSDADEGRLTIPLRLVGRGNSLTVINRLLLLVRTADVRYAGTDSNVRIVVTDQAGHLRVSELITEAQPDTQQDDLERAVSNWYYIPVTTPFTESDLRPGGIELVIDGDDVWTPEKLFLFGLDTSVGRPANLVPLKSYPTWRDGPLSANPNEGKTKVVL